MRKPPVIIIGAGLFGSIAATLARRAGRHVTVIDSGEAWAASPAAGCVIAPSWLSSLTAEQVRVGMKTLASCAAIHPVVFSTNAGVRFKAARIALADLLVKPDITSKVAATGGGELTLRDSSTLRGQILLAAGVGSAALAPSRIPAIRPMWGASLLVPHQLATPRIHAYAPYKQAVAFNVSCEEVWVSDGTALSAQTWHREAATRIDALKRRAAAFFNIPHAAIDKAKLRVGARPYVDGYKNGYFAKVGRDTWVSTGGAKNGTILAAYQAAKFMEQIE